MRRGYQLGPTLLLHLRVKGCPFVVGKHACPIPLFPTTAAPCHYFKCSRPLGSLRSLVVSDAGLQDGSTLWR